MKHNELAELNNIIFCWLPSHIGIKGNEKADIAAKSAFTLNISDLKIPFTDFKPSINTFLRNKWLVVLGITKNNQPTTPTRTYCKRNRLLPYYIQSAGRPGTGSLPRAIAPPDHPQMSWNTAVLSLGEWQANYRIDRKEEVTLARLRIGHIFSTHSFLLKGEDWPLCIPCQEPFSVKHFL